MKFLPCNSEAEARAKSHDALERRFPNRRTLQLARRSAEPWKYPHPDTLGWDSDMMHAVVVDEQSGAAEIEIPDSETSLYPDDIDNIRNERSIGVAQGPPST